jgi:hypothetical protein
VKLLVPKKTYDTAGFKRQNLRGRYWTEEQLLRFLKDLFSDVDAADFDIRVGIYPPSTTIPSTNHS